MKMFHILLAVAAVVLIVTIASLVTQGGYLTVDEVTDEDGKIGEFVIVDGDTSKAIVAGMRIDEDVTIAYDGPLTGWSDIVEVQAELGLIVFSIVLYGNPVDYVFVFDNIVNSSLEGNIVSGKPVLSVTAKDGFSIELLYYDSKGMEEIQEYRFITYDHILGDRVELPVMYGDRLFLCPSIEQNADLMAFALGLEMSSGIGGDDRAESIIRLLRDIGCANARANGAYGSEQTMDSVDVAIGSKHWNGSNLIFVVANGCMYDTEFASNLMLGGTGSHHGFSLVSNEIIRTLKEFISDNGITGKTKILITGYSRTAAGANLAAAYLSDAIAEGKVSEKVGDIELAKEDLYGYSFEAPLCGYYAPGMTSPTDGCYDNIWYVTNPDDIVTHLPPKDYGFVRYGHQIVTESHDPEKQQIMLQFALKYYGEKASKLLDMSRYVKTSDFQYPSDVYEGFIEKFFTGLGTREFYHTEMENDLAQFTYAILKDPALAQDILDNSGGAFTFLMEVYNGPKDKGGFDEKFRPVVEDATEKHKCSQYTDSILNSLYQLSGAVHRYSEDAMSLITDKYVLAMVANTGTIFMPHMPAMTYCYMMQESTLYVPS